MRMHVSRMEGTNRRDLPKGGFKVTFEPRCPEKAGRRPAPQGCKASIGGVGQVWDLPFRDVNRGL